MNLLYEYLCRAWCRRWHGSPYYPISGTYKCRKCLREYEALPQLDIFDRPRIVRESGIEKEWREQEEKRAADVAELNRMYEAKL